MRKKTRTSRHSRNSRHDRTAQRRAGRPARPDRRGIQMLMTRMTPNGLVTTSSPLPPGRYGAMQRYLRAHDMLPPGYGWMGAVPNEHEREALAVLGAPKAKPAALLKAIVILGHTPTTVALAALQRHAASGRRHAAVAELAASECIDWMTPVSEMEATDALN